MHLNLNRQFKPELRIAPSPVGFRHHPFLWLLVCFLAAGAVLPELRAQTSPPPAASTNTAAANRFLLIVDTSSSMKRRAGDVIKIANEIITTGASGQLRAGDTLGVWTFNQDVYSDLPLQNWVASEREQIALRTDAFLKQQHYANASRFDKLLPDLGEVIRASDIITIFIISNGEGKMKGTPFDQEINELYQQNLKETKSHRVPIVTVLQAKGGRLLRYTVNAFPWPVVIPEVPIPIKSPQAAPTQPAPAVAQQNSPRPVPPLIIEKPVTQPVVKTESAPPVTAQPTPPPIVSAPPVAAPAPVPAPPIATAPPAEAASATHPPPPAMATPQPVRPPQLFSNNFPMARSPRPMIPAPKPAVKPFVPADPTPGNNTASVAPQKPVVVTHTNPVPAVQPSPIVAATNIAAPPATPATNTLFNRALAFISPASAGHPKSLLIAGLTLVLIAILLIILMVRRSRDASGPSLITRSLGNKKK